MQRGLTSRPFVISVRSSVCLVGELSTFSVSCPTAEEVSQLCNDILSKERESLVGSDGHVIVT